MDGQVFLFGSFTEAEIHQFQAPHLDSPQGACNDSVCWASTKKNGSSLPASSSPPTNGTYSSETKKDDNVKAGGALLNGTSGAKQSKYSSNSSKKDIATPAVRALDSISKVPADNNGNSLSASNRSPTNGTNSSEARKGGIEKKNTDVKARGGVFLNGTAGANHSAHDGNSKPSLNSSSNVEEVSAGMQFLTLLPSQGQHEVVTASCNTISRNLSDDKAIQHDARDGRGTTAANNGLSNDTVSKPFSHLAKTCDGLDLTAGDLILQKLKGSPSLMSSPSSSVSSLENVAAEALKGEAWLKSLQIAERSGKRVHPRGLSNTGNSCFLNSTLQALLSCSPFVHLLTTLQMYEIPKDCPTLWAFSKFIKEFEEITTSEEKPRTTRQDEVRINDRIDVARPFAPMMFDSVIKHFSPVQPCNGIGKTRQEDVQEFLSFAMDRMHAELLKLEGRSQASSGTDGPLSYSSAGNGDDDDWETVGPKNRTAVVHTYSSEESALSTIFKGQLCSVVKTKGNKASATVQPFWLLHLDILSQAVHSVEDALRFFVAPESLEGYKSASGKAIPVSASKSIKIHSLPRILVLHLMRFSYGPHGSTKLHKPVHFPLELMLARDLLSSTLSSKLDERKYELVATVTHHGKDPSRGHYTADCLQHDGRWLHFDDSVVSFVGVNKVLQEQAYLLFYKQSIR